MYPVLVLVLVMLFATTLANVACWLGVFAASPADVRRMLLRRPFSVTTIRTFNDEADGWYQWWRRIVVAQLVLALGAVLLVLAPRL